MNSHKAVFEAITLFFIFDAEVNKNKKKGPKCHSLFIHSFISISVLIDLLFFETRHVQLHAVAGTASTSAAERCRPAS